MMIAFVRVGSARPGKTGAAMAFAKDISAYIKAGYGVDLEVLRPVGGNPQRVAWSGRYANLTEFEAFNGKLMGDAKYWEKVNAAADCFMAGTFFDSIWQTV
jgi:hypothetical protein